MAADRERVRLAALAVRSADLAQAAYEATIEGSGAADVCAAAVLARQTRLAIEQSAGAEADAWAAALAEVIVPGLAADLAPVATLAPGSALAAP